MRGTVWRFFCRAPAGVWAKLAWPAYRLGYMTALDDVDRTGLRPMREDTKERAAERSFRRYAE